MKKLLLATGIMALSLSALGAGALDAKEATVEVKAKVVQPLDIKTTPLDFGIMIPGERKWGENPGTITITGTEGENIKFFVKESEQTGYKEYAGPKKEYNVTLITNEGKGENQKLETELTLFTPGAVGDSVESGVLVLEKDGKKEFMVNGWANASQNQEHGEYKGKVYIKAMYQ